MNLAFLIYHATMLRDMLLQCPTQGILLHLIGTKPKSDMAMPCLRKMQDLLEWSIMLRGKDTHLDSLDILLDMLLRCTDDMPLVSCRQRCILGICR